MIRLWLRMRHRAVHLGGRLVLAPPLTDDSVDTKWTPFATNENAANWRRPLIQWVIHRKLGAGEGIRTPDPNLGKVMLDLSGAIRAHPPTQHPI